jgi:hypothetical protein
VLGGRIHESWSCRVDDHRRPPRTCR